MLAGLLLALSAAPAGDLQVSPLDSPAGHGARYPRLERGADGLAYLAWTKVKGKSSSLHYASLGPTGFSAPSEVARGEGWFVNWADFPAVTALADGNPVGFWLESTGVGPYSYGVRYRRRVDGAWGEPGWLHEDRGAGEHGFVSAVTDVDGWDVLWLDGRTKGSMALYLRSLGAEGDLGAEQVLDERVCDCCQTALARLGDGALVAVYRDRGEKEQRDMSFVVVREGAASKPAPVSVDGWTIAGCPVNGPALAARGDRVACAWYTETPSPRVNLAVSRPGCEGFEPALRVDLGEEVTVGRTGLAWLEDGSLLVSYMVETDAEEARGQWRLRRFVDGRAVGEEQVVAETATTRSTGFLSLLSEEGGALAAWTRHDGGEYALELARIRLGE